MNSLERLISSSRGEPLDRVPVAPGIGHYAAVQAKEPMTKVAFNPTLMAQVVLRSLNQHGYDSCGPITDYGLGPESMGSTSIVRDWEQTYVSDFPLKEYTDVTKLKIPNPLVDDRMPVIIECEQILIESVGDKVGVSGGVAGPLSFASNLRGLQEILYDLTRAPDFVHEIVSISLEAGKAFAEAQVLRGGVKTINIYEPAATLISNQMVEEFSFSYLELFIEHMKKLGATVLLHICGDTTRLVNRMVEIGADILSLEQEVDLAEAKRIVAGRASISGNVASQILAFQDSEKVYLESCQCIKKAALGGQFTLSSACEVPLETPAENIDAMVRAVRDFGAEFIGKQ